MAKSLIQPITPQGVSQGDLVIALENIRDLVNQIRTLCSGLRAAYLGNQLVFGLPVLARSSNFDVAVGAPLVVQINGALSAVPSNAVADTGTTKTIATTKWNVALISVTAAGAATATWGAGTGYDSEALAVAAMPATPVDQAPIGYVTVQAAGATWTAGTDALAGGSGGTPANATNYYNGLSAVPSPGAALSEPALTLAAG